MDGMVTRLILASALMASILPARADTIAVYASRSDDFAMTMTVEIADSGEARVEIGGPILEKMPKGVAIYGIFRDGEDFMVNETPEGVSVIRTKDAMMLMAERQAMTKGQPGVGDKDAPAPQLVARGEMIVNGRTGTAFYQRGDEKAGEPMLVVSHDPMLSQLGREMARRFGKSAGGMKSMGFHVFGDSMLKALDGGTPLAFGGLTELQSVRHDPVPASRFALPAPPKTLEEIRQIMMRAPAAR